MFPHRGLAPTAALRHSGVMDYAHPAQPDHRLSNDDRSTAIAALATHQTDGRLSASEYSERAAAVSAAQTWGDLAAQFSDLPALPTASGAAPTAAGPADAPYAAFSSPVRGGFGVSDRRGRRPLGGRIGIAIVSASPLVAVVLFFVTGFLGGFNWSWLWFLMVPIAGAIVYAPSWYDGDGRRR